MKQHVAWALMALAVGLPMTVQATVGALDAAPAATLLFPYVEADLDAATGVNTVLSIHSASAQPVLANVVLWTEAGIPVFSFNLYLTGYDVETFSLRDVVNGTLPATASSTQDPADTISPMGARSVDAPLTSCTGVLPPAAPDATTRARVRASLTGAALPGNAGMCAGPSRGDGIARGYVTVDVLKSCTLLMPGQPGYFGSTGVASYVNALLGEFVLVHPSAQTVAGASAVHLEATAPGQPQRGSTTFYGRLVGFDGSDARESLPGTWAADYVSARAELLVWRDPRAVVTPWPCAAEPPYGVLPLEALWVFDRQEQVVDMSNQPLFPHVVNRTVVGDAALPVLAKEGWMILGLHHRPEGTFPASVFNPDNAQSVVLVLTQGERLGTRKGFTALRTAMPLDSQTTPLHVGGGNP